MKKNEFLQDVIGLIDDELVMAADHPGHKRRAAVWSRWVAAAACLVLLLGSLLSFLMGQEASILTQQGDGTITVATNLWQQENFNAFSLSYSSPVPLKTPAHSGAQVVLLSNTTASAHSGQTVLETKTISISPNQTFKFERLIAQRYAVYRSETGFVMFYDTVEDRQIDLQERILGNTDNMLAELKKAAYIEADTRYPGFLNSPVNRQILDLYLTYAANSTLPEHWEDITALTPDTDFLNAMGFTHGTEEEKCNMCWNLGWELYIVGMSHLDDEMSQKPYTVSVLGIDETNGICIIATKSMGGSNAQFLMYDVRTDTCKVLTKDGNSLNGSLQNDGYLFRFSADGTVATVAYPEANLSGGNIHGDITQRFVLDTDNRLVANYQGEQLGVYFLVNGTCQRIQSGFAASELFISPNTSVLYYKQMQGGSAGKTFYASDVVWYNRLKLCNRDTDNWVFHTVNEDYQIGREIVLQGKFVRFAANETVVIMERGGDYYAYSLHDGKDVTQDIKDGTVSMYAHEQLATSCQAGQLYVTNMFTGQQQILGRADRCILSSDEAFAFVYCDGDGYVTCYNVASGENCKIAIDKELSTQLFAREDAVLQMSYNEQENTLLLSYYAEEDAENRYATNVDFYDLLAQLQDQNPNSFHPNNSKVITDMTVTEEIMELFRSSADRYDHPDGILYWENYYPEGVSLYQNKSTIFECLGLTEPENYLDVNGTQFLLYEDEDEKLDLIFWEGWLLFDYQDHDAGFHIEYTANGKVYEYSFITDALA